MHELLLKFTSALPPDELLDYLIGRIDPEKVEIIDYEFTEGDPEE